MDSIFSLLRSLRDSVANVVDYLEQSSESLAERKFGRFILGSLFALIPISIYWGSAAYFRVDISLTRGFIGSLLLMLVFGVAAIYRQLGNLIEGIDL